ncbi:MAG: TauD/TfdA family dioxygenase [Actinomycetia bacterium]|nr:TauD/TfdA family dioxygenase [Actinomycetes bacterium]
MDIQPLSPHVGSEITGVDLAHASDAELEQIRQVYLDRGVVFFRHQQLTPEDHIAFAKRWSDIDLNAYFAPVDGYPEIAHVVKEPHQERAIGGGWHTDHSYDEAPAMGSILRCVEAPPVGGDTMWACMGAALDSLSAGFKDLLRTLRAVHTNEVVFSPELLAEAGFEGRIDNDARDARTAVHPVVVKHPDTGRELLYVNPGFTAGIEGWNDDESKALLDFLFQHAVRPTRTVRFHWEPGSVAFWDNRRTWHMAINDYPGERRSMHRITLTGVPLGP